MDRFLTERRFVAITFLLFASITLFTTLHHEPWGDETDVWVVGRDGGLPAIFAFTAYRGTPALWYVVVWPFAASGAPYFVQQILHLAIAWAAVLLFLRFAPFPRWVRALFALSYFPAFEYSAVARPYALLMLLLFFIAHQWRTREEQPIRLAIAIALLANTTLYGLIIAAVLGALLLLEWRRWTPILIMLAGGLVCVAQLWPRAGGQKVYTHATLETVWYTLAAAFFPEMRQADGLMLAIPILLIVLFAISRQVVPLLFLIGTLAFLMVVYVYVWMGGIRHAGIVTLVVIAAVWMAKTYGPLRGEKLAMIALSVAFAWSVYAAGNAWVSEKNLNFSDSRGAGMFLQKVDPDTQLVAPLPMSVTAYLPGRRFWYASLGEYGTYTTWDARFAAARYLPMEASVSLAKAKFSGKRWLLVTNTEIPSSAASGFRILYRTKGENWVRYDEHYWIYEPIASP